jgi:molecular chaperone HscB
MEQLEWREAVAEARAAREQSELEQLYHRVKQRMKKRYEELAELIDDQHDFIMAADRVRRLMFLEKLLFEIDEAMAAIEN